MRLIRVLPLILLVTLTGLAGAQVTTGYPTTPAEIGSAVTPTSPAYEPGHIFRYMTAAQIADVLSGVHSLDDAGAITTCLSVGFQHCFLPGYTYRLASGITVPNNTLLTGEWMAPQNGPAGTILQCDLSVATCVTVRDTGGSFIGNGLTQVSVTRAAGTIPSGSIGVKVGASGSNTYNPVLSYVFSQGHSIGFDFDGGISVHADHLYTGAKIGRAHV